MRAKLLTEEEDYKPQWIKSSKTKESILKALEGKSLEYKFIEAIKNNVLWVIEQCIEDGFDPSWRDNWAIWYVSKYGNVELLKLLLKDKRVDPSAINNSPLRAAMGRDRMLIILELLKDKRVKNKLDNDMELKYSVRKWLQI